MMSVSPSPFTIYLQLKTVLIINDQISQLLAGFWKNGWRESCVPLVMSHFSQSVRSQPASGWLAVG